MDSDDTLNGEFKEQNIVLKAFKTLIEMCRDRKYTIHPELHDHNELTLNGKEILFHGITTLDKIPAHILVFKGTTKDDYDLDEKKFNQYRDKKKEIKSKLFILYNAEIIASQLLKKFLSFIDVPTELNIEAFDIHYLYTNPTTHVLQPKWRLLSEDEIVDVLSKYQTKTNVLSRVMISSVCIDDPINRYYGGKPPNGDKKHGDMYEITRDGINIFYRKVVSKRVNN
jgi:DNA-directed RNA polymerase subunit H (RpoH/RPB5)